MAESNYVKSFSKAILEAVNAYQEALNATTKARAYNVLQDLLLRAAGNAAEFKELRDGMIQSLDNDGDKVGANIIRGMTGLPIVRERRSSSFDI